MRDLTRHPLTREEVLAVIRVWGSLNDLADEGEVGDLTAYIIAGLEDLVRQVDHDVFHMAFGVDRSKPPA